MSGFSERVKLLRTERKLSQQTVAMELKLSQNMISYYENGTKTPAFDGLIALADYFNVSIDYLVGRSDNRDRK